MTLLAAVGLAIAAYLLTVRLLGEPPVCGPIRGCDVVAASEYATVLGVPVALFGVGFSLRSLPYRLHPLGKCGQICALEMLARLHMFGVNRDGAVRFGPTAHQK